MSFLKKNLDLLSTRGIIAPSTEHANLNFIVAKSGDLIIDGYYSTYNPLKEATQILIETKEKTIVFLGLGMAYQIIPFLESNKIEQIFIIDNDWKSILAVFDKIDLSNILSSVKIKLLLGNNLEDTINNFKANYSLIKHGIVNIYPLRKIIENNSSFYQPLMKELNTYFTDIQADIVTQAHFGKKWQQNIITNLKNIKNIKNIPNIEKAVVIGAGSSLNDSISTIKNLANKGYIIIACDSVASILYNYKIKCDFVVNIDSQLFARYHFIGLDTVTLIADLTAFPSLTKKHNTIFFSGSHPLCQWISLNHIATKSGNVGTVAYQFAKSLGAKNIKFFGLDFIYSQSSPYAQGLYIYDYMQNQSNRLNPVLNQSFNLIFKNTSIEHSTNNKGFINYKPALFKYYETKFLQAKNENVSIWNAKEINGMNILKDYYNALKQINLNTDNQSSKDKYLEITINSVAASFYKEGHKNPILAAKEYTLNLLEEALKV